MNLDVASTASPVGYGGAPFAVLLLHTGGPTSAGDMRSYLDQRLLDQAPFSVGFILRAPFLRVMSWMQSRSLQRKLLALSQPPAFGAIVERCASGVEQRLRLRGRDAYVRGVCRFLQPPIEPALAQLYEQGLRRLVLVFLHAQTSAVGTASIWREYRRAASQSGCILRSVAVESWYADGRYLDLMADNLQRQLEALSPDDRRDARVLFCADGIPEGSTPENNRYIEQVDATIQGIVARLPEPVQWGLGFHRGSSLQRWVGPTIDHAAQTLAETGGRHLVCMPLAVQEQLEALHEIDVRLASQANTLGFESFHRIEALRDHPALLDLLADLIEEKLTAE